MFDRPGIRYRHAAMHTAFEIFIPDYDPAKSASLAEECAVEITDIELAISPYQEGSDIARLNSAAGNGDWIRISWPTRHLLQLCLRTFHATNTAFNPFAGRTTMAMPGKELDYQTAALLEAGPAHEENSLTEPILFRENEPEARLDCWALIDMGAVGKGWAVDACIRLLLDAGVPNAIVHAGTSSLACIGGPWPIIVPGVDTPILLENEALSVSRRVHPETDTCHIMTITSDAYTDISVCIGPLCAVTDALSTACVASGSVCNWPIPDGYKVQKSS